MNGAYLDNLNVFIGSVNSFHLPKWRMQCTWGIHKIVYFLKSNSSYTTGSWFSNATSLWSWRRTVFSAGGCEVPRWCVRSCLETMRRPLWSRGPMWMALMPLPRQGQNIEFAWLWMCQKSSIIFCSGDPEASYKGRVGGTLTLEQKFLKLGFLGCDCIPGQL